MAFNIPRLHHIYMYPAKHKSTRCQTTFTFVSLSGRFVCNVTWMLTQFSWTRLHLFPPIIIIIFDNNGHWRKHRRFVLSYSVTTNSTARDDKFAMYTELLKKFDTDLDSWVKVPHWKPSKFMIPTCVEMYIYAYMDLFLVRSVACAVNVT